MALESWAIEAVAPHARAARSVNSRFEEGVINALGNAFKVQAQASPTNHSVRVGSGTGGDEAFVASDYPGGGVYGVRNTDPYIGNNNTQVSFTAPHATLPRDDLVVLRVYDTEFDSSGQNTAVIQTVGGVANSTPADPATPATALRLARVRIRAANNGQQAVLNTDITDLRLETQLKDIAAPPRRVCQLWRTTAQGPLAAGSHFLQWNGEDDPYNLHNPGTSLSNIYAPLDGYYSAQLQVRAAAGWAGGNWYPEIRMSRFGLFPVGSGGTASEVCQVTTPLIWLTAGQFIESIVTVPSSFTVRGEGRTGYTSWFSAFYHGR